MDKNKISWDEGKRLYARYRKNHDGIRLNPDMASVCLICGSIHVYPKGEGEMHLLACRNCGFTFERYLCTACGKTIDGRDPCNPGCKVCGGRICTCGVCFCLQD